MKVSATDAALLPLFQFLETAKTGEQGEVQYLDSGQLRTVTAYDSYRAASGNTCRRYQWLSPLKKAGGDSSGGAKSIACRAPNGTWYPLQPILNGVSADGHYPGELTGGDGV